MSRSHERLAGWKLLVLVAVPLFGLYLPTARTDLPYHIDAMTNVYTAWTIGTAGTPVLVEHRQLVDYRGQFAWVVPSRQGPVSQYPPGTALLAAPLYATLWQDAAPVTLVADLAEAGTEVEVLVPNLLPAALIAAGTTSLAIGLLALTVRQAGGSTRMALTTGLVAGVGTSAWTVAADALWQHGPNMMWVALGVYLASRERWGWAGLAFGALTLTRPPVVIVGIALGAMLILRRDWKAAFRLLSGALPGAVALLAYNWWLFGEATISGGYGDGFANRGADLDIGWYAANIAKAFVDPQIGMFIWSPFLAVLVFALVPAARRAPDWSVAAASGGLILLLLQLKLNRASGGTGFWYYRYPLESLAAAAPVLAMAWQHQWREGVLAQRLLLGSGAASIVLHAMASLK